MLKAIHRLARNSALLLASSLVARGASAILFIVAARRLSQDSVGVYSLAITYSVVLLAAASWGLDQILIRDVAKAPSEAARYLANFFLLRTGLVGLVYGVLWLVLSLFRPYADPAIHVILIVGLSTLPDSLNDVCLAVFIARERLFYPSVVSIAFALLRIGLGTAVLFTRPDLILLAWVFPITSLMSMLASLGLVLASGVRPALRFGWTWLRQMLVAGGPLAAINILLVLDVQAGVVFLSLLISETAVALYGAANAIFAALAMLPAAWQASIFPVMSRLHARSDGRFGLLYEKLYLYLTVGALALILSLMTLAEVLVLKLYGPSFAPSVDVLRIMIIILFFSFLNIPNSRLMIILNRQDVLALFLTASVTVNGLVGWWLIPSMGVMAVAVSRLLSAALFFLMTLLFVSRRVRQVRLLSLIGRPMLAGLGGLILMLVLDQVAPLERMVVTLLCYGVLLWILRAIPREDLRLVFKSYLGWI